MWRYHLYPLSMYLPLKIQMQFPRLNLNFMKKRKSISMKIIQIKSVTSAIDDCWLSSSNNHVMANYPKSGDGCLREKSFFQLNISSWINAAISKCLHTRFDIVMVWKNEGGSAIDIDKNHLYVVWENHEMSFPYPGLTNPFISF